MASASDCRACRTWAKPANRPKTQWAHGPPIASRRAPCARCRTGCGTAIADAHADSGHASDGIITALTCILPSMPRAVSSSCPRSSAEGGSQWISAMKASLAAAAIVTGPLRHAGPGAADGHDLARARRGHRQGYMEEARRRLAVPRRPGRDAEGVQPDRNEPNAEQAKAILAREEGERRVSGGRQCHGRLERRASASPTRHGWPVLRQGRHLSRRQLLRLPPDGGEGAELRHAGPSLLEYGKNRKFKAEEPRKPTPRSTMRSPCSPARTCRALVTTSS